MRSWPPCLPSGLAVTGSIWPVARHDGDKGTFAKSVAEQAGTVAGLTFSGSNIALQMADTVNFTDTNAVTEIATIASTTAGYVATTATSTVVALVDYVAGNYNGSLSSGGSGTMSFTQQAQYGAAVAAVVKADGQAIATDLVNLAVTTSTSDIVGISAAFAHYFYADGAAYETNIASTVTAKDSFDSFTEAPAIAGAILGASGVKTTSDLAVAEAIVVATGSNSGLAAQIAYQAAANSNNPTDAIRLSIATGIAGLAPTVAAQISGTVAAAETSAADQATLAAAVGTLFNTNASTLNSIALAVSKVAILDASATTATLAATDAANIVNAVAKTIPVVSSTDAVNFPGYQTEIANLANTVAGISSLTYSQGCGDCCRRGCSQVRHLRHYHRHDAAPDRAGCVRHQCLFKCGGQLCHQPYRLWLADRTDRDRSG